MSKLLFTTVLLLIVSISSSGQQTNQVQQFTKTDYLKKSKTQKTIAWVLAGTGVTSVIISIATLDGTEIYSSIGGNNKPLNRFGTLFFGGSVVALSSIPFFIVSSKNKKKAMSLAIKNEPASQLYKKGIELKPVPSLALKISL